ncbi:nuclease-related domain-containing protein [Pengzhenrongella frigida]|uniref:NERD domain-containing protein n=1 Tax=Pengzhenrongella frigida TaxID=1259133 RepID=A0A4Q5MZE8_9MICO|nr:nuclease-related domain-containing protein [Cellulomonas sp. HLT2-17]RYV49607.1 NERD domain-containing protein [Cellulomonas sp. HLT2-17]
MVNSLRIWIEVRRNRRRAGARARRKYNDLRKAWLQRNRKWWLLMVVLGIGAGILLTWLVNLGPGDQSWAGPAVAGALFATLLLMRQSPPVSIASWQEGAFGEEETAKQLRGLEKEGWVVLHDLANGSKNFDHVVLGPTGVYCLNSKWSGYRLEPGEDGRLVGRHKYDDDIYLSITSVVKRSRGEAAALSEQIEKRCGKRLWVQPVIVWWGDVTNGGRTVDGVGVVQGKVLADRLRAQKGRQVPQFDRVVDVLRPGRHAQQ